ncbi:hypothetical protein BS78_01G174900 [Paspalum vaginatum]|nr:hypothetical protein BS78_01G174900 [Paspalum vaginatum]
MAGHGSRLALIGCSRRARLGGPRRRSRRAAPWHGTWRAGAGHVCGARQRPTSPGSFGTNDRGGYGGCADPELVDDGDSDGDVYEYADDDDEAAAVADKCQDADASSAGEAEERGYVVLTEQALRAHQEADTARVAEVLSVPTGSAGLLLLHHFRWRVGRVLEEWHCRRRSSRRTGPGSTRACGDGFDEHPAGVTRAAACAAYFFCGACWHGYLSSAVHDDARCPSLWCPEPSCDAAVALELVDDVLLTGDGDDGGQRGRGVGAVRERGMGAVRGRGAVVGHIVVTRWAELGRWRWRREAARMAAGPMPARPRIWRVWQRQNGKRKKGNPVIYPGVNVRCHHI